MSEPVPHVAADTQRIERALAAIGRVVLGARDAVRLALSALLAGGHILIEDPPGVGKTTLAHTLARVLGLSWRRVQFTSDLLPADIIGVSVWREDRFVFQPGPVFTQVLLADELNRATPKTQSALLEAMEEGQVSVEGRRQALPRPFLVIATQNPLEQAGTFPLPESQLDRFMMRIHLGTLDAAAERALLAGDDRRRLAAAIEPVLDADSLLRLQKAVARVYVSEAVLDHLQALLARSRDPRLFQFGLSPRAGLALKRAAQAWALIAGRDHVLPEDVQAVAVAVAEHRLRAPDGEALPAEELHNRWLAAVAVD
ncbi:MAG: hypothetical protein KatS3mg121_0178 [Gammaproteobacteria bacterium]|nr:MAG: hypothetical protein KatS3mg121_0178 [Gammaproteobacteria bacterium]